MSEPRGSRVVRKQPIQVPSTRMDGRLSDTHIFDTLVAELGDPAKPSAEAKVITHSRWDERLVVQAPAGQLKKRRAKD